MSGYLAAALARLDAAITAASARLPKDAWTTRMVRQLRAVEAAPQRPEPEVLEAVRQRLRRALSYGGDPDRRDLTRAPWILWQGDPQAISFPGLLDRVIDQAASSQRVLRYLIEAWLRDFSPKGSGVASTGLAIQRLVADSSSPRMEPWRSAHAQFRLFDAADGPKTLATKILSASQPVATVLEAACFADEARAVSAYLRYVQEELLKRLTVQLAWPTAATQLSRGCDFLVNGKRLRFDDSRAAIAAALCRPWLYSAHAPDGELERDVTKFLVDQISNPQIRPGRWAGVEKESDLVRRWLARASLKLFFELIAEHALDQHWKYRQAFWSACLAKNAIDDAWLALGTNVYASARAQEDLGAAFGRLEGAGASGDQSVLLLRIGPVVIAEWSHNGSMRAWLRDDAPALGLRTYARSDLIRPCLPFPPDPRRREPPNTDTSGLRHVGAATEVWQRRASLLLAQRANVHLQPKDWRLQ